MLEVKHLFHSFPQSKDQTVKDVSFSVKPGTLFGITGKSGSGKTTILRCIAGLEPIQGGSISWNDQVWSTPQMLIPPHQRGVNFVFHNPSLFPHLTVEENIIFGVRKNKEQALKDMAQLFGLTELLQRFPHEISDGQKQRVAFARALAPRPQVLLLDEALNDVDDDLKRSLLKQIKNIFRELQLTVIFITHNESEIFHWADEVAVVDEGILEQVSSPEQMYRAPFTPLVARTFGQGSFLAVHSPIADMSAAATAFGSLDLSAHAASSDTPCQIFIRPEQVDVVSGGRDACVTDIQYQGAQSYLILSPASSEGMAAGKETLMAAAPPFSNLKVGDEVAVRLCAVSGVFPQPRACLQFV